MKCPECGGAIPMPDLACDCPEPTCFDCHRRLRHPGTPCPDCPNSQGYFTIGRRPNGQKITAICATCEGERKVR